MVFEKETNLYKDAAITNKFNSQDTQFNVVNGKISYLISDSDIEEYEDKSKTVTSRLNSSEDSIDRHSQQISSLQTDIVGINGDIDTFKSEVNTFEQTTNSTISSITSTVATKSRVWTVQPTVPYLSNDFWIRDNTLYVCTVSRSTGSFNNADWKPATKGRIFTSTPTTPYYSGDVYVQGNSGDILFCSATRLTGNYTASDWSKASKYTDDTAFNTWTQNTYNSFIEQLPSQINLQVTGSREINANTKYTSKASIIATINDQTFESGVKINADRITLNGDATINAINGATGNVTVNANKVNLSAYATFTSLKTAGATVINGANIDTETITAAKIASKTITAKKIAAGTITSDQIASKTIKASNIAANTITSDQIASRTIKASNIAAGTITANEIAAGTITADKLNVSYLTSADVGDDGSTVISGSRITTGSINANLIKAGTLQSQDSAKYPNFSINLTDGTINIKKGGINLGNGSFVVDNDGNVTMKKGSITIGSNENFKVDKNGTVTMKTATITGYLKPDDIGDNGSTTISGNRIQTGTISANRLDLSGVLKVGALNGYPTKDNLKTSGGTEIHGANITTGTIKAERLDLSGVLKVGALDGYATKTSLSAYATTDSLSKGTTTISGGCITTGAITGKNSNVVFDLTNGTLTMKSGSINIGDKFIVYTDGSAELKSVTITGSPSISGYATNAKLDDYVTIKNLKTRGKTSIHGENIDTGIISAEHLDLSGTLTVGALDDYAKKSSLSSYALKTSLQNGTTTISGGCVTTGIIKDSDEKVVFDVKNGSLKMNSGSIKIGNNFEVDTSGNLTAKTAKITSNTSNKYSIALMNGDLNFKYNGSNFAIMDSYYTTRSDEFSSVYITVSRGRRSEVSLNASSYASFSLCGDEESTLTSKQFDIKSDVFIWGDLYCKGDLDVDKNYGKKNKIIHTKDYGTRELYSYETASPLFGDVGSGIISEDGICYIQIDPILNQTISKNLYQVFLQKCGEGNCYVYKKETNYFIVKGTPLLKFDWEIKCKQIYFENVRLDNNTFTKIKCNNDIKYDTEASEYLNALKKGRLNKV